MGQGRGAGRQIEEPRKRQRRRWSPGALLRGDMILFGSLTLFLILFKLLVLPDAKKGALEEPQLGLQMAAFSICAHEVFSWCMCLKRNRSLFLLLKRSAIL